MAEGVSHGIEGVSRRCRDGEVIRVIAGAVSIRDVLLAVGLRTRLRTPLRMGGGCPMFAGVYRPNDGTQGKRMSVLLDNSTAVITS